MTPGRLAADVDGRPDLVLVDEERESVAELLAEMLLEAIEDLAS
jgi:hypothetical protein